MTSSLSVSAQSAAYLSACIRESLQHHLYENAKWLGERLVAVAATEANLTLLATCYYQANQVNRAYHVLKASGTNSHAARYLHALCCLKLGKLSEAREALTKCGELEIPNGAAGLYLLGRVYRLVGRPTDAREHFVRALRVNPLLWSAFEELCALGGGNEAQEIVSHAASCSLALVQQHTQERARGSAPISGSSGSSHNANSVSAHAPNAAATMSGATTGPTHSAAALAAAAAAAAACTPAPPAQHSTARQVQQTATAPTAPTNSNSAATVAFTPTAAHTPLLTPAPASLHPGSLFNTTGGASGTHTGAWDTHKFHAPPPPPQRASRSSSAAAAAAAADTPIVHRPASGTTLSTHAAGGATSSRPQQQQQQQASSTLPASGSGVSSAGVCALEDGWSVQSRQAPAGPEPTPSTSQQQQQQSHPHAHAQGPVPSRLFQLSPAEYARAGPSNANQQQQQQEQQQLLLQHFLQQQQQSLPSPSGFATPTLNQPSSSHATNHSFFSHQTGGLEETPGMAMATPHGAAQPAGLPHRTVSGNALAGQGEEEEPMEEEEEEDEETEAGGPGSSRGGTALFVTPGASGTTLMPPAPPQKNAGTMAQLGFPGVDGPDSATRPTDRSHQQGPNLHHGHQLSRHQSHLLTEDGKVRKISGKYLFHDSAAGPQSAGLSSSGSARRRSSRLAAQHAALHGTAQQQQQQQPVNEPPTARTPAHQPTNIGSASTGNANTAAGMPLLHPQLPQQQQQQQQHLPQQPALQLPHGGGSGVVRPLDSALNFVNSRQSQNLPDPARPPPPPTHAQNVFDAKLVNQPGCMPRTSFLLPALGRDPVASAEDRPSSTSDTQGQVCCMSLLHPIYQGYLQLAMYRCTDALQSFRSLQPQQARTAWVWCQVARAYFERMDYSQAAHAFESARQLDKLHVEGMEVYSTVLWHLKRDTDLSYLAQDLVAIDRLAPQTWCALGNFFSLQREHEAALKLFERALQLDPTFTYAYTLSGHENAANDDLDSALTCYRNALRLDPRHYNAMYGMGQLYFRQEKYDVALVHFKAAALVNPQSSVLRCYWGMALAKQGSLGVALTKLQEAVSLDPRNPLARYEKAGVLAANGTDVSVAQAVAELEALMTIAPGEASVYFQMGKLYKRLGNLGAAQRNLETALSLNSASSADAGLIKVAIEKLGVNDDEEEEEL